MELLSCYIGFGLIIFIILGLITNDWKFASLYSLIWPVWVGYLLISLFWGIGSKL